MARRDRFRARRRRLIRKFRADGVDALLVTAAPNVYYLSGFRGEDSALLVTREEARLLTDSRFAEQAGQETAGIDIVVRKKGMMATAADQARRLDIGRLGVEARVMTLAQRSLLVERGRRLEVKPTHGWVEDLRVVKDAAEVAAIRRAAAIAAEAFERVLAGLTPGRTEIEVARELDRAMEDLGAEGPAFPTIVAAGERTSLPHARPTGRRIRRGEPVLVDWGARYEMYHSDLTRVVFVDRISPFFQRLYGLVLAAQRRAAAQVRPGRKAGRIDGVARTYLKAHRHGKHFGHGLGHGVGLEVHEAPSLHPGQEARLRAGMVITVEPGVYVPGRGGIRIEDLLLVTRKGRSSLAEIPKSLNASQINA